MVAPVRQGEPQLYALSEAAGSPREEVPCSSDLDWYSNHGDVPSPGEPSQGPEWPGSTGTEQLGVAEFPPAEASGARGTDAIRPRVFAYEHRYAGDLETFAQTAVGQPGKEGGEARVPCEIDQRDARPAECGLQAPGILPSSHDSLVVAEVGRDPVAAASSAAGPE